MTLLLLMIILSQSPAQGDRRQPPIYAADLEHRVHELINEARREHGLRPLQWDERFSRLARDHSKDMARRGYFDHVNPEGKKPVERGRAAGIECRKRVADRIAYGFGENIFQNNLYDRVIFRGDQIIYEWKSREDIAVSTVRGWMESPGHRNNVLGRYYDATGIGVAVSPDDKVLITQVFC